MSWKSSVGTLIELKLSSSSTKLFHKVKWSPDTILSTILVTVAEITPHTFVWVVLCFLDVDVYILCCSFKTQTNKTLGCNSQFIFTKKYGNTPGTAGGPGSFFSRKKNYLKEIFFFAYIF